MQQSIKTGVCVDVSCLTCRRIMEVFACVCLIWIFRRQNLHRCVANMRIRWRFWPSLRNTAELWLNYWFLQCILLGLQNAVEVFGVSYIVLWFISSTHPNRNASSIQYEQCCIDAAIFPQEEHFRKRFQIVEWEQRLADIITVLTQAAMSGDEFWRKFCFLAKLRVVIC